MIKITVGNLSSDDIERAVLPAIIYAQQENDFVKVRGVAMGWWRWGVRITVVKNKLKTEHCRNKAKTKKEHRANEQKQ